MLSWGFALVWMPEFLTLDEDPWVAKLEFLHKHGLSSTSISLQALREMEPGRLDRIYGLLDKYGLSLTLVLHADYFAKDEGLPRSQIESALALIERVRMNTRSHLVTTHVGSYHRFMRSPDLDWQMSRLARLLGPLASELCKLGMLLGIENHGDYYCSDLAQLCRITPHLGIFLDTGNTFLIGESPSRAFADAAPFVVGAHFKDQRVAPRLDTRPLCFEVAPAVPGEGDVPLRQCYELLCQRAKIIGRLTVELELIPVPGVPPVEALARSLDYIRGLGGLSDAQA